MSADQPLHHRIQRVLRLEANAWPLRQFQPAVFDLRLVGKPGEHAEHIGIGLAAAQTEVDNAKAALDASLANLDKVVADLNNADYIKAEKRLAKRDVNFAPKTVDTFEPKVRTY